jgi:hypothetical protein
MPRAPVRQDSSEAANVASLVRLHHRRRGWAFVAAGSVIGLAVYAGIDGSLFRHGTGTAGTLGAIPAMVLVALAVAGITVVIADTARLRRADASALASAKGSVSHHPLYAHVYRYPPRHHGSWVAAVFMLAAMACISAYILPQEVNAWTYVAGGGQQDTFHPESYANACMARLGCSTTTEGYLARTGADVIWGTTVPLGQPFSVRDPLWAWGTGRNLINGDGSAISDIVAGLFFDAVALLLLYVLVVILRDTSPRRAQHIPVAAGPGPGPPHQAHHPDRARHADGTPRRARRGRARR